MAEPTNPGSSKAYFPSIDDEVPTIDTSEGFASVVRKLTVFIALAVDAAYTHEQLRTSVAGQNLRPLVHYLSEECHHPAIVAALLATRYLFVTAETDDSSLGDSRGFACELVAWQYLTFLSEKELIDYLLYEVPQSSAKATRSGLGSPRQTSSSPLQAHESTALLQHGEVSGYTDFHPPKRNATSSSSETQMDEPGSSKMSEMSAEDPAQSLAGMNSLEIAAVANAKKFISQKPVQKIVEDVWNGNVIFWESLSIHAIKKARPYNKRVADPFTRLRVPKYQKTFQVLFFVSFLALYYAVLVERNPRHITVKEVFLYFWIAAYAYDEFGEFLDAGLKFYQTDL